MTDSNRMTDQERKNGPYHRPPTRFGRGHQHGYPQNDFHSSRDDDRDELTRVGMDFGRFPERFGDGPSLHEDATDPEYWRERADRFNRSQDQGDWNERLWRLARDPQRGGGYGDSGQDRIGRHHPASDRRESQFGKGPKGYKRSDERIAEDINQRLTDDHHIDASDIEVKVHDGEVSLSGTVSDRRCRREVEDLVESISGVCDVSNQLKIQRPNEPSNERGSSRSAANPASKSNSASKSGGSGVA